jgi:hypothetical protein
MREQRYLLEESGLQRRVAHINRTADSNRLVIIVERRDGERWSRSEVRVVQDTPDRSTFESAVREMLARFPGARLLD